MVRRQENDRHYRRYSSYRFNLKMALAGSWSVVQGAHIQAITFFFIALTLSRSRSVDRRGHVQAFARKTRVDTLKITVGGPRGAHIQAFTEKLALSLKSTFGCPTCTYPSIHHSHGEDTLKSTVGCPRCTHPSIRCKTRADTLKITDGCSPCTQACGQKSPCVETIWGHRSPFSQKKNILKIRESWGGRAERRQRVRQQEDTTQQTAQCDMVMIVNFSKTQRGAAPYTRRRAMHRSKLVMDARAGGMSISSGSGGASGMGASSSLSEGSAMAQSAGSSGAGSGSMCQCVLRDSSTRFASTERRPRCGGSHRTARDQQPKSHAWTKGRLTKNKKRGNFLLQEYFRRGRNFYYSLRLIQKNRRRVKLQTFSVKLIRKQSNCNASKL